MAEGLGTAPAKPKVKLASASQPSPVFGDEILDWDCALETPPPAQRTGRIEVDLRKAQTGPSPV
jgi:hypothetical protein